MKNTHACLVVRLQLSVGDITIPVHNVNVHTGNKVCCGWGCFVLPSLWTTLLLTLLSSCLPSQVFSLPLAAAP